MGDFHLMPVGKALNGVNPGILRFKQTTNLGQITTPYNNQQQKKRTCKIVNFAVPVNNRVKLKENKKKAKYLGLSRELKKMWNMKVLVIPILIGVLVIVTKGLVKDKRTWK